MNEWVKAIHTKSGIVETAIAVRFREVLSLQILSKDLAFHPSMTSADIRKAIDANEPAPILPKPWPPNETDTPIGMRLAALIKMKSVMAVRTSMGRMGSKMIRDEIKRTHASMDPDLQDSSHTQITATVALLESGEIVYEFVHPSIGHLPLDTQTNAGEATIDYGRSMIILGLEQEIEVLRR